MIWTEEKIAEVAKLAQTGMSSSEIGDHVGANRNQVIGLIYRKLKDLPGRRRENGHDKNRGRKLIVAPSVKASRKQGGILGGKPAKALKEARRERLNLHSGNIQNKREARENDPIYREPVITISDAEYDAGCPRVALNDHRDSQCRWPLGDPHEVDFAFCGHPRSRPSSYCFAHHQRSIQAIFRCSEAA